MVRRARLEVRLRLDRGLLRRSGRSHLRGRDRAVLRPADELAAVDRWTATGWSPTPTRTRRGSSAARRRRSTATLDYFAIRAGAGDRARLGGTVEFFPEEGKYHLDGHRKCGVRFDAGARRGRQGGRCPVCGGAVTVGVLHRVEKLADRSEAEAAPPATAGAVVEPGPAAGDARRDPRQRTASKTVERGYDRLLSALGPELSTSCRPIPLEDIARAESPCSPRRSRGCAPAR